MRANLIQSITIALAMTGSATAEMPPGTVKIPEFKK